MVEQRQLHRDCAPEPVPSRRHFFVAWIYALTAVMGSVLGAHALVYLLVPARMRGNDEWAEVGDLTNLAPGAPAEMSFRRTRVDGWKVISEKSTVWVTKSEANEVVAFAPQCTHLGCAYHWEEGRGTFVCPCHNSIFSIEGKVLSGPATRPLDRYETKLQGKTLLLGRVRHS